VLSNVSFTSQEVPNEVLQVGNSLRTLDLTNNKLGSQILHVTIYSIQCSIVSLSFIMHRTIRFVGTFSKLETK